MVQKSARSVHSIIINFIRLILVLMFFISTNNGASMTQFVSVIAMIVTFLPWILYKYFKMEIPAGFEIITLMFIYGILFMGEVRNFYIGLWWWDVILNLIASVALSFVGLSIMYVLYKEERININPLFISVVTFCFAVAMGGLWEIFEFFLDEIFGSGLQKSLGDTMGDLIVNAMGALFVSISSFFYIRKGKSVLISTFITTIMEKNLWIFGPKNEKENPLRKAAELIKKGEGEDIEFKSSFRVNLHTKEFDKKIEHGILKTIVAFLNTKGGNLLVGVDDGGRILGLERDGFQNDDKLGLHLTNLIKNHIGNEFLPFIKFRIIKGKEKKILLITCDESKKRVFLKVGGEEEFYVRNGPASVRLEGSSLVDYIQHKFSENN